MEMEEPVLHQETQVIHRVPLAITRNAVAPIITDI